MRRAAAVAAIGTVLLASACGGSSSGTKTATAPTKPGATVTIPLLSFTPDTVTIKAGQTVTWINGNDISHVLVEGTYKVGSNMLRTSQTDDKAFNLKVNKKGDRVSYTYPKAGTFTYYCTIHEGMNATVVVK